MSRYQYVIFQAVDSPLNDKQLAFARRQSSRAKISRWSLSVEYNYGYFHGDVDGLLRRGYDVYLEYNNFGTRQIKLRLPNGLPFTKGVWSQYVVGETLCWKKDTKGRGGILTLSPYHESLDLGDSSKRQEYLDAGIHVRESLLLGDLRGLYLLWLCAADDDYSDPTEMIEPPVPYGISDFPNQGSKLLSFFGLDPLLLTAAGKDVEDAPVNDSQEKLVTQWVETSNSQRTRELLLQLLLGDSTVVKAEILAEIRDSQIPQEWPTSDKRRSLEQLLQESDVLREKEIAKQRRKAKAKANREAAKEERQRADRMAEMRKAPEAWIREAEGLVGARGTQNYKAAVEILHDLREAIGGGRGDQISRRHAADLVKQHPNLYHLKGLLRKRGLLD